MAVAGKTMEPLRGPSEVIECTPLNYNIDYRLDVFVDALAGTGVFDNVDALKGIRGTASCMIEKQWDRYQRCTDEEVPCPWPYRKKDFQSAMVVDSVSDSRPTIIQTSDELVWIADSYDCWDEGKLDFELYVHFAKYAPRMPPGASLHQFEKGHDLDYNEAVWGSDVCESVHVRSTAVVLRVRIRSFLTPPCVMVESMTERWHGAYARASAPWAKEALQEYRERHAKDNFYAPSYWCGLTDGEYFDGFLDGYLVMGALLDRSFPWHEEDPVAVQLYLYAHFKDQNDAQHKIDQSFFKKYFKARRTCIFDHIDEEDAKRWPGIVDDPRIVDEPPCRTL